MKMQKFCRTGLIGMVVGSFGFASAAQAEKWDMPMAYSASNFHSQVGAEFAKCVTTGTSGEISGRHESIIFG